MAIQMILGMTYLQNCVIKVYIQNVTTSFVD